jgi:phosphoglycerol transferase MdoB-like AlkP superfamily enzyme
MFVVETFSTFSLTTKYMKLFASKFYQTLVLNVATIAAIVVGLYQFAVRAFNENEGPEKTRKVIQIVLLFVDTIVTKLQVLLNSDVPVAKASTTR